MVNVRRLVLRTVCVQLQVRRRVRVIGRCWPRLVEGIAGARCKGRLFIVLDEGC